MGRGTPTICARRLRCNHQTSLPHGPDALEQPDRQRAGHVAGPVHDLHGSRSRSRITEAVLARSHRSLQANLPAPGSGPLFIVMAMGSSRSGGGAACRHWEGGSRRQMRQSAKTTFIATKGSRAFLPCRAAFARSGSHLRGRDHRPPPGRDRFVLAEAECRAAGPAGPRLSAQRRDVRRAGRRVRAGAATAWRYVNETAELLAARAPKLRKAVRDVTKGRPRLRDRGRDADPR